MDPGRRLRSRGGGGWAAHLGAAAGTESLAARLALQEGTGAGCPEREQ